MGKQLIKESLLDLIYKPLTKKTKRFSRANLEKHIVDAVKKYYKHESCKAINIGAGGAVKSILVKNGVDVIDVDIDEKRKPDIVADMENMSVFPDSTVDIFFCIEVLEHVANPINAVSEVYRILKPGGVIICSTPFIFPIHDEPYDYYRYTKYGIEKLFSKFNKIKLTERNTYFESIYVLLVRLIMVGTLTQKCIGMLMFPFVMLLYPVVASLSPVVTNKQCTTGYFYIYQKP